MNIEHSPISFKVRLQDAESRFLDSLSTRQDIEIFRDFWSLLVRDIEDANNVDDETVTTYHEISRLVDELSHSMIGFYSDIETIDVAFHQDLLTHLQEYKLPSTSFVYPRHDVISPMLQNGYHKIIITHIQRVLFSIKSLNRQTGIART